MAEYVGGASNTVTSASGISVTIPEGVQAGDKLYVLAVTRSSTLDVYVDWNDPAGWTRLDGSAQIPRVTLGVVWERTAQSGDAGSTLTLAADAAFQRALVIVVALRGYALTNGEWLFGEQAPVNVPVALSPGDFFGAFAFSSNNSGAPANSDGVFPRLLHPTVGFNPTLHGAFISGTAPAPMSEVRVSHDIGATLTDVAVFAVTGTPSDGGAARIRSHVSEDAGSLFQATQAVAVELGISEAFPYATSLNGGLRDYREALTPEQVALRYYPVPTRNQEMLTTVEGETNLGRLAHTIAPRIFTRGASIPGNVGGVVTAQQAIQHVVNRWASEHPWLVFEPIPDLRLLVPEAVSAPRQYYVDNPTAGVLTTSNIVIEQEGNERRTMREVLDEWLRIFPGTILRQTSAGTIEIVPRVGPDAPDGPALELSWRDFARFSDGEDDPRGVYNRARTTSQGWEWEEEHPLLPPLVTVGARGDSAPASAVDDLLPLDVEPLPNNQEREFSTLVDLSTPIQVDVVFQAVTFGNKAGSGAPTVEATIPASFNLSPFSVNQHTFTWTIFDVDHVRTTVNFKRSANGFTVEVPSANRYVFGPNPFVGMRYGVYIVEVTSVTGTAWTRSNTTVEAEWGTEEHHVPAEGGGDALAQSRALYGVRSASLQSNVFQLTPEQAMDVARSYVLFNINPRTIRDVQQSEWNAYPVKFDHVGRLVQLPNGERAVVENRDYSDSFAPDGGMMASSFTATVSHSVIDTTTEYLFNSDGSYWENDDGTISEVL